MQRLECWDMQVSCLQLVCEIELLQVVKYIIVPICKQLACNHAAMLLVTT